MGALEKLGPKVYLDSNFFIYTLEGIEPWVRGAAQVLAALDQGDCIAVTSELSLAECLVRPLELGRMEVVRLFLEFLQDRPSFSVVPVSREVLITAAELRARSRIKLPDAIHAATAQREACFSFLTNDDRLNVPGIEMIHWLDLE